MVLISILPSVHLSLSLLGAAVLLKLVSLGTRSLISVLLLVNILLSVSVSVSQSSPLSDGIHLCCVLEFRGSGRTF